MIEGRERRSKEKIMAYAYTSSETVLKVLVFCEKFILSRLHTGGGKNCVHTL